MKQKLMATEEDRKLLLDAFARGLEPGETIIKVTDTYRASGRITVQIPRDADAELLVSEPPKVQPGGITELISYVRVRETTVRDVTFHGDDVQWDRDLPMTPVRTPM